MATHTSSPRTCVARKKRLAMKVGEDQQEAARVFYVAATRATQRLILGVCDPSAFASRF
jgi:ATP-dependent exoDNAse (exonuclease V) beta subunit